MRVLLATPTLFRVPTVEYLMSLQKTMNLLYQHGIALDTAYVGGDAFVGKARNGLVQSFIETWKTEYPADVLVFMDDDQGWDEGSFLHMVQDPHEIVAAAVPKKVDAEPGEPQTFNNVLLDLDDTGNCIVENGMLRARQIGSGFMVIKRSAIEKMIKAYPQRYAPGDGGQHELHYNFFDSKVVWDEKDPMVIGQFWGEDLIFCQKWCALGEKIWIWPNAMMSHVGRKTWTGDLLSFLQKHAKVELKLIEGGKTEAPQPIPETLDAIKQLAA